jgi:glucuronoxylan 4-O-methyltransferase
LIHNNQKELLLNLPIEIMEMKWDIIFVDGPEGWSDEKPGRMKSIFTAAQLAHQSKDCYVFVHDCDRPVEAIYSRVFLCDENLISIQERLRKYYIPLR